MGAINNNALPVPLMNIFVTESRSEVRHEKLAAYVINNFSTTWGNAYIIHAYSLGPAVYVTVLFILILTRVSWLSCL